MARLAALVLRPNKHLVTYHGVLAPAVSARDRVVPELPDQHLVERRGHDCAEPKHTDSTTPKLELEPRPRRPFSWTELLERVLAAIHDPDSSRRVLGAMGLSREVPVLAAVLGPLEPPAPSPVADGRRLL